jgi:nitroreductase
VRLRLDFDRPVSREVLTECVRLALQAPSASNRWALQFVVVTDPDQRAALAEVYRAGYEKYRRSAGYIALVDKGDPDRNDSQQRTARSADHLAANLHRAPALVVACGLGRATGSAAAAYAGLFGSVMPGLWSFMLAARLHGLGTAWTSVFLLEEEAAAGVLGLPLDQVTMAALTPVAYTRGTDFRPAGRPDPVEVIHWDRW